MLEIDLSISRPVKTGIFLESEQGDFSTVLCLEVAYQSEVIALMPPFGTYELSDECFDLIRCYIIIIIKAVCTFMIF